MFLRALLALQLLAPSVAPPPGPPAADPEVAAVVMQILGRARHPALAWPAIDDVSRDLWAVYDAEADRLAWFEANLPLPTVADAVATIADTARLGLAPQDYDATWLQAAWVDVREGRASASARARFDVGLSVAAARVLKAVHVGRVEPDLLGWKYAAGRKTHDGRAVLDEARSRGLDEVVRRLEPATPAYVRTRAALAAYRALAAGGEPPRVPMLPAGVTQLTPGMTWAGVPALAARLQVLGDLATVPAGDPSTYAGALVDAVKGFQRRHGLQPDGGIGRPTLTALDVPLVERVRQLERSLERQRWLPDLAVEPHVLVNIAAFRLRAVDPRDTAPPLRMKVVVGGAAGHQTPLFIEQLEYIEFRPYWTPPRSIVTQEILPKARADATFLARNAYEIVASGAAAAATLEPTPEVLARVARGELTLRQRPGASNALGLVKFMFPNDDAVYMHGTPTRGTFARARRDASHGCIRLEHPEALAAWLLRDQPSWTPARIEAAMKAEASSRVTLGTPMMVVLFYDVVEADEDGVTAFLPDIYGHDAALAQALAKGYPYPAPPRLPPVAEAGARSGPDGEPGR